MRLLWSLLLLLGAVAPAVAQTAPRATLSLEEALELAKRNNPVYLQSVTGRSRAAAGVRAAYGALLPSADASMGASLREGRPQFFGGVAFGATSDILSSSWNLSANSRLSFNTFNEIKRANASLDAAEADVDNALYTLRNGVTGQFLLALQLQARAALQDTLVTQQRLQLQLAQARAGVGAGTDLDVKRAEVGLGQQEVAALRARNSAEVARLQLFQQVGVAMPPGVELTADSRWTSRRSRWRICSRTRAARTRRSRPRGPVSAWRPPTSARPAARTPRRSRSRRRWARSRRSSRTSRSSSSARRRAPPRPARTASPPTPSVGASACRASPPSARPSRSRRQQAQAIRDANNKFPFDFTRNPYNLSMSLSLPLFDGLAREQRLQEANAGRTDARYNVRRQELALTADVTSALVTLRAARQTVDLQDTNAATAREALQLAEERYRVGASTFVDLTTARAEYERAETDRIDALYEFHRAFAALEAAVGRTLR
jgi:outer membrane protein